MRSLEYANFALMHFVGGVPGSLAVLSSFAMDDRVTDVPSLLVAQPVFVSSDLTRTETFYTEKLNFTVSAKHDDWLKLDRDALTLHFALVSGLNPSKNISHAYVRVRGVDSLFEQIPRDALHPNGSLRSQDYGMREFAVIDPDGNLLTFGEPTSSSQ